MTAPLLIPPVIDRLKAEVPALYGQIFGAVEMAELIAKNALPQRLPAVFVLPLSEDAENNAISTGLVRQPVTESFAAVLLQRRGNDVTGARAHDDLFAIKGAILAALIGWRPQGIADPILYRRAQLLGLQAGAVFIQLEFTARWYWRGPAS